MIAISQKRKDARFAPLLRVHGGCEPGFGMHDDNVRIQFIMDAAPVPMSAKVPFHLPPAEQFHILWPRSFQVCIAICQPMRVDSFQNVFPKRDVSQRMFAIQMLLARQLPMNTIPIILQCLIS